MKRVLLYILGLNLIAVAVVLNIRYGLGVAAFSSVMYSISEIYHMLSDLCAAPVLVLPEGHPSLLVGDPPLLPLRLVDRPVRLGDSRHPGAPAPAADPVRGDHVPHRHGGVPVREDQPGPYPHRRDCTNHVTSVSPALLWGEERV